MEANNVSVKQTSTQYGLVLGGILSLITITMYALNPELFVKWWVGIITIILVVAVGIVSTAKSKSNLGGFMTFKEAFSAYFITVAIGLFIATVVGILIFNVIDPEMATYINERAVEVTREFMEKFNTPEADMNAAIAEMQKTDNFSIANQAKSYVFGLVFQAVLGLLIGLIFKRKDPNAID
ncbi:MAG: DUF4199 domain-containing protein [Patiriisocius sp.]|uniref:DUF4199 domain-containing protein n=1 Tax=Patiriisocius sp. TaxID=2822396 RepID=UPI003EF1D50E